MIHPRAEHELHFSSNCFKYLFLLSYLMPQTFRINKRAFRIDRSTFRKKFILISHHRKMFANK